MSAGAAAERRGALALVLVTALWGISFPLVGGVMAGRPPALLLVFLFLRFSLASAAFLPLAPRIVAAARGHGARPWLDAAGLGVLLLFGFALQTLGLVDTTPSRSAFITMMSVLLVPFIAALWHRRAPSRTHVLGCLVAFVGLGFVLSPGGELAPNRGDWLTLACAVLFAVHIVALERATRRSPALLVAFGQIAAVALLAGGLALALDWEWPAHWEGLGVAVGVTGLVCTTLALGLMAWGQARVPAEVAAVIFALEPIFAALFEFLWLGSGLSGGQWVAGLCVVATVAWAARAPLPAGPTRAPSRCPGASAGAGRGVAG